MPRFIRITIGLLSAVVAGVSVFLLILIVTGVGPGRPRLPKQTTATVVRIERENVSVRSPRYRYLATVRWTNEHGTVLEQRDTWGRSQPDLAEGDSVSAVAFQQTSDPKTRVSSASLGLGYLGDYWRRQGLWDWVAFWGPILVVVPATYFAFVLLRCRGGVSVEQAT